MTFDKQPVCTVGIAGKVFGKRIRPQQITEGQKRWRVEIVFSKPVASEGLAMCVDAKTFPASPNGNNFAASKAK